MDVWAAWIVVIVLYGVAIFFIVRTFVIALSFHKGEVPYVPINRKEMMLAILALKLRDGDRFIDIGSGDGRVVMYVAHVYPGVKCVGVERNRLLVAWSKFKSFILRRKNVEFIIADAVTYDYSEFNKIFIYLTMDLIEPLVTNLDIVLVNGSKVVSCKFGFDELVNDKDLEEVGDNGTQLWVKK